VIIASWQAPSYNFVSNKLLKNMKYILLRFSMTT